MKPLRLALVQLLLGAWLALSLATAGGAILAFQARDEVAADGPARTAATAQAAAFNARMFRASLPAQVVIAAFVVLVVTWPGRRSRVAAAALVTAALIVGVLAFVVLPRVLELAPGSLRDGPGSAASLAMQRAHRLFFALDLAKCALVAIGSLAAIRTRERS